LLGRLGRVGVGWGFVGELGDVDVGGVEGFLMSVVV